MTRTIRIDPADYTPPFEQLRRQLLAQIQLGVVSPGEKLPPVRQLARDLGVGVGTVARTYRELEAAGAVTTSRGGGTRVVGPGDEPLPTPDFTPVAQEFVAQLRNQGATDDQILDAVGKALTR